MLTQDHRNFVKGIWSIIMSIPVIFVVIYCRNVQEFVTYTGGFVGSGVILTIPSVFVHFARKTQRNMNNIKCENPNRSVFRDQKWLYLVIIWNILVVVCVFVKLIMEASDE